MSSPIKAQPSTADTSPAPTADGETFDLLSGSEVTPTANAPSVRTLHEPPDIWDLVPETHDRPSPFVARITSVNPLTLVIVLVVAGAAVLAFVRLKNSAQNPLAAFSLTESTNTRTAPNSPATVPVQNSSSLDQPRAETPVKIPANTTVEPDQASALSNVAVATVTGETGAPPRALPVQTSVEKPRRQNLASKKTAGPATVPRTEAKESTPLPIPLAAKSEDEKFAISKREVEKVPSPQLNPPAKVSSTPKAKVIPWP